MKETKVYSEEEIVKQSTGWAVLTSAIVLIASFLGKLGLWLSILLICGSFLLVFFWVIFWGVIYNLLAKLDNDKKRGKKK